MRQRVWICLQFSVYDTNLSDTNINCYCVSKSWFRFQLARFCLLLARFNIEKVSVLDRFPVSQISEVTETFYQFPVSQTSEVTGTSHWAFDTSQVLERCNLRRWWEIVGFFMKCRNFDIRFLNNQCKIQRVRMISAHTCSMTPTVLTASSRIVSGITDDPIE